MNGASTPSARRWVQVKRDGEWIDLLAARELEAAEHVERMARELGAENVRLKPPE